ncbi:MAG TPA: hypothetical protein VGV35_08515 [Bryobacteraceae bacterium]|nr:hypothetical protein [Bryobacteraceae bacterium]
MISPSDHRLLAIYSGAITAAFLYTITTGFAAAPKKASFEEIDVKRINVIEPDGTLRLVISDKTRFPGLIIKGKEYPHDTRKTAGVLFFDDEGTENGGLTFGGMKDKNGKASSYGHLSFDKYMQDQVFTIDASKDGAQERTRLGVWDRPDYPITDLVDELARIKNLSSDEHAAALQKFLTAHGQAHPRLLLGRSDDRSVSLRLKDTEGRDRIVIKVDPDGTPAVQFLDENGKVIAQLPAKG